MFTTEVHCYVMERLVQVRMGLIWLLVLAAVLLSVSDPLSRLPMLAITSALFILTFRLWDDLADLDHDRVHHPGRCLGRAEDLRPIHATLWLLIGGLAVLFFRLVDGQRALAFLCLVIAFLAMYGLTARRPALRSLRLSIVLTKYPACVLLLADAPGGAVASLAALGVYLPPVLDEARSVGPRILLPAATLAGLAALGWLSRTTFG
jgi:hypothetical protein